MTSIRTLQHSLVAAAVLAAFAAPAGAATTGSVYTWSDGSFSDYLTAHPGLDPLPVLDTLSIVTGGTKYFNSFFSSQGTVAISDNLYFRDGRVLSSSGLIDLQGDVGLYDGGNNGGVTNTGIFRKSQGAGASYVQITGFTSNGIIDTQVGTLVFNQGASFGAGSQFTGAGTTALTSNANFAGALQSANLVLAAGNFDGSAAQINGQLRWTGGKLLGSWELASGQVLALAGGDTKYLDAAFTNLGTVSVTDILGFQNGHVLDNQGVVDLQGDLALYDGGNNGGFINSGVLRKSAGAGTGLVSINGFSNSGTVEVQSGTLLFNAGAVFNDGSRFIGDGQVHITSGASFNGGFYTVGNLVLASGLFTGTAARMDGPLVWSGGSLGGDWTVPAGKSLTLAGGGTKYLDAALSNLGMIAATDNLYLQNGRVLTNQGLYDLQGDLSLYDGGNNGRFVNSGTLRKSGGTETSLVSIIGFSNTGTVDVRTGTLHFNTGAVFNDGSQFTGAGRVVVSAGATFNGGFGTSGQLFLSGGGFVGHGATANGDLTWTSGSLAGDWTLTPGHTMAVTGGGTKYLNGEFSNQGSRVATDGLYLQNGYTLTNMGTYDMQGDIGLHDGGNAGRFNNTSTGLLLKSSGDGTSYISHYGFTNSGTIEARIGVIQFNTGAQFNEGTRFNGAGQVWVTSGATFNGAFSTQDNLVLAGGTYIGGDDAGGSAGTLTAGTATVSSATLVGQWAVAAGAQLDVVGGGTKYINATLVNQGRVVMSDNAYIQNGKVFTNQGVLDLQGDTGLLDGGNRGALANSGILVKSAGGGVSSLADISVGNTGVIDVQVGTIALPRNFSNQGTLKGTGTLATDLLTNAGTVAPGASPGTLSISGSFVQAAQGVYMAELFSATSHDLLAISGSATLDGTLALSCFGGCTGLATGDVITILTAGAGVNGSFASVTTTGFLQGFEYSLDYSVANEVDLRVLNVGAVPEPGTVVMLASGLAVLGWLGRRRREVRQG